MILVIFGLAYFSKVMVKPFYHVNTFKRITGPLFTLEVTLFLGHGAFLYLSKIFKISAILFQDQGNFSKIAITLFNITILRFQGRFLKIKAHFFDRTF